MDRNAKYIEYLRQRKLKLRTTKEKMRDACKLYYAERKVKLGSHDPLEHVLAIADFVELKAELYPN